MPTDEEIRAALEAAGINPDEVQVGPKPPRTDPAQGAGRGGDLGPRDFRTASDEAVAAEMAKYGLRRHDPYSGR